MNFVVAEVNFVVAVVFATKAKRQQRGMIR